MDQKIRMIAEHLDGARVTDLSHRFGVSRKTIYKWIGRYQQQAHQGLEDRSRRPLVSPQQSSAEIVELLLSAKKRWPTWGPKKLVHWLARQHPGLDFPAASTAGAWLKKHGLVKPRRRCRRVSAYTAPLLEIENPNDVWSVDYKGDFQTGDGRKCYALTISDNASRYLLSCEGLLGPRYQETQAEFERVFRRYGLPQAIRSDNGVPFAGRSIAGLSRLSVWWLKLGIIPERIAKGCPQENGCHERMHRTLKAETTQPAAANLRRQNLKFGAFRKAYNRERPHESLEMRCPSQVYRRSAREYRNDWRGFEYDHRFLVRSVKLNGEVRYRGGLYFLTNLLRHERIGFWQRDAEGPLVYAGTYPLCKLNLRKKRMRELTRRERLDLLPMSPV